MTKTVTDVIAFLILPPSGPLLLAVAGLLLLSRKRRLGVALAASGMAFLWLSSLGIVGNGCLRLLEPPPLVRTDLATVQAIVVLGGGLIADSPEYAEDVVAGETLARLRYAARLGRETGIPILVSAGNPYGAFPEAEAMARVLKLDLGLEARWTENASATTAENAARAFAVLSPERRTRVALVTTAWHMPRARRSFAAAGFDVVPAATSYVSRAPLRLIDFLPSANGLAQTRIALWELAGSVWYSVK